MAIRLNFRAGASGDGQRYYVDGIPEDVWEKFVSRAKEVMPEKGDKAWAAIITETIASVLDGDKFTFMMTEIPNKAIENVRKHGASLGINENNLVATLFQKAEQENLAFLKFSPEEGNEASSVTVVIFNIPRRAVDNLHDTAKRINDPKTGQQMNWLSLMGLLYDGMASGEIKMDLSDARQKSQISSSEVSPVEMGREEARGEDAPASKPNRRKSNKRTDASGQAVPRVEGDVV